MTDQTLYRRVEHLPEHDGATGYYTYEPVPGADQVMRQMAEALRYYAANARSWISGNETKYATKALAAYERLGKAP